MYQYRWQLLATCPGTMTGEDEVDTVMDVKTVGIGLPLVCAISNEWYDNEILCLRQGLEAKDKTYVPFGYQSQLLIQAREKTCQFPEYITYKSRLDSLKEWPKYMNPSPEKLARAGFFYKGPSDRVTCFKCGVTLLNWEPTDVATKEHQRHSPNCSFINMIYSE